jgi:hypothetical protein
LHFRIQYAIEWVSNGSLRLAVLKNIIEKFMVYNSTKNIAKFRSNSNTHPVPAEPCLAVSSMCSRFEVTVLLWMSCAWHGLNLKPVACTADWRSISKRAKVFPSERLAFD